MWSLTDTEVRVLVTSAGRIRHELVTHAHACMYVCIYVCMYVCMYVCTYVRMYMYVCVRVCMFVARYTFDLGTPWTPKDNFYFLLNQDLRTACQPQCDREERKKIIAGWSCTVTTMLRALGKLPRPKGQVGLKVYRGVAKPGLEMAALYTVGRKIRWSGFTSTSTHAPPAVHMAGGDGGTILVIVTKTGRDISCISCYGSDEKEILLAPSNEYVVATAPYRQAFWYNPAKKAST